MGTGLGTVNFSKIFNRETFKHMQHSLVKHQIVNVFFQWNFPLCTITLFGCSFFILRVPFYGAIYIIYLHVLTVIYKVVLFFNQFSLEKLVYS